MTDIVNFTLSISQTETKSVAIQQQKDSDLKIGQTVQSDMAIVQIKVLNQEI